MTDDFVFFPFTHITRNQLNTVLAFFPSIKHLSVSKDYEQDKVLKQMSGQGKICPVFFSEDEIEPVEIKFEEYRSWIKIHKGNEHNLKLLLSGNPYFTNDSDVTFIKSEIRGAKEPLPKESQLHQDLLFLKMAQLCDEQNESIDLELENLDKTRDELFSNLKGIDTSVGEIRMANTDTSKDCGGIMTGERIQAWSRCMALRKSFSKKEKSPVFITTSEAVFDYLESMSQEVVNALDIDKIKVHENDCEKITEWQYQFCESLMNVIQQGDKWKDDLIEGADGCSLSGKVKLNLFSGKSINKLFNVTEKHISVCLIKLN